MSNIIMPSNPEDLKALKGVITEISNALTKIDAEKDFIKDALEESKDKFDIPPALIKKLATDYHKDLYNKKVSDFEDYSELYEKLFQLDLS